MPGASRDLFSTDPTGDYWVPFNGDFGLHDAPWQTMPFGSQNWPTQGSHGCVHVATATLAWIYRWAQIASTVVTVES